MFAKNKPFAFETRHPVYIWTGKEWRHDRRSGPASHLGRRQNDVHFPYSPLFVTQLLAQPAGDANDAPLRPGYRDQRHPAATGDGRGKHLKLRV